MRWKLLVTASLAAALVGAGTVAAVARFVAGQGGAPAGPGSAAAAASLLAPLAAITYASIFVYRHTARRRSVQAMMTALLAGILTLAALLAGSLVGGERTLETAPAQSPPASNS